ncbi:hypothetical protein [Natronobacterium gregoryi]|nr:hypothetical protein [Natronobacterium gregoryi]
MTTMPPAALLAGFCAVLSAVAVWQLVSDDDRDPIDVGTTLIVLAITFGAVVWAAIGETWLTWLGRAVIAVAGLVLGCIGLALVVRYWNRPSSGRAGNDDLEVSDDRL